MALTPDSTKMHCVVLHENDCSNLTWYSIWCGYLQLRLAGFLTPPPSQIVHRMPI